MDKALTKSYNPAANDIVKGLKKDSGQSENVVGRKQDLTLSRPLDNQNMDPNKAQSYYDYQTQQEVWAQELRRADDRSHKFKQDLEVLEKQKQSLEVKIKDQEHAIMVREQEI